MNTVLRGLVLSPIYNFIASQAGWLACVISAARLQPWLGALCAAAIIFLHLAAVPRPGVEAKLLLSAVIAGAMFDSLLVAMAWLRYPSGMVLEGVAPYWIVIMWPLFATTLNISMGWMKGRLWLAALVGAVFAPLAYWGGRKLGAVEFISPTAVTLALAAGWALLMPLLVMVAVRYNGARGTAGDEGPRRSAGECLT